MSAAGSESTDRVYYDPYRRDIVLNPYPTYRRLREEAPLYYNEQYDFYAVSRYEDVRRGLRDHETFISGRGGILELIQQDVPLPPGTFIFEDPPLHTVHRSVVQRIFAPRRLLGLEERVRAITVDVLERIAGRDDFDFIADIGALVPMRVIGTLLGIPEEDFQAVRETVNSKMLTGEGEKMDMSSFQMEEGFERYIDWRAENPADDVITELLSVEFTDETGAERKLHRDELVTFINVLAGAGNETTNKLIGWTGKLLAEHPDQRRDLAQNPDLIPDAVEEILRCEPPGPHVGRYVARDAEFHGQTVPAGSAILFIVASANRDDRAFPDPERFDVRRERSNAHCSFGYGIHTCIGQVLARLEGKVVLEELLRRCPDWEVDMDHARLLTTSTVRGWETLPAYVNAAGRAAIRSRAAGTAAGDAPGANAAPASIDGEWEVTIKGPTGPMASSLLLETVDGALQGSQSGEGETNEIDEVTYEAGRILWINTIRKPMKLTLKFQGTVAGDTMSGKVKAGFMGSFPFTAVRK